MGFNAHGDLPLEINGREREVRFLLLASDIDARTPDSACEEGEYTWVKLTRGTKASGFMSDCAL